jgi:hypothetical protein
MAKVINKGWSKPGDEIPQPISVVLGKNLRQNSKPQSPPPKDEEKQDQRKDSNCSQGKLSAGG